MFDVRNDSCIVRVERIGVDERWRRWVGKLLLLLDYVCTRRMKRHGDDNEDKQPGKRPCLDKVPYSYAEHTVTKYTYPHTFRPRKQNEA